MTTRPERERVAIARKPRGDGGSAMSSKVELRANRKCVSAVFAVIDRGR
jgi:hypothetical protein